MARSSCIIGKVGWAWARCENFRLPGKMPGKARKKERGRGVSGETSHSLITHNLVGQEGRAGRSPAPLENGRVSDGGLTHLLLDAG